MLSLAFLIGLVSVFPISSSALGLRPNQIKNLVTFGDSYTDVGLPADGGQAWPVYAASYSQASLLPFARSGATCSNNITFRPFPSLFESQLPLYFNETKNGTLKLRADETLYTLWLGTNDVGAKALLSGQGNGGKSSIVDVTKCLVNWISVLYRSGARNFLFQNMIPLQHVPMFAPDAYFSKYWVLPRNATEWNVFITELVQSGNELTRLMIQDLAPKLSGAHIGLFDSHALFTDMLLHPENYLNGTAPLNTTGAVFSCIFQEGASTGDCTEVLGSDRDSFLWYDELHPSEQADWMVAKNIAEVIKGKPNKWTTWLS